MTATDVAFGSAFAPRGGAPARWMVALFALALAVWGLVALAVFFAGSPTYAAIARESGFADTQFLVPAGAAAQTAQRVDLAVLVSWHERWVDYVLGRGGDPLRGDHTVFTPEEVAHMRDVRGVFAAAQAAMYVAATLCLVLLGITLRIGPRAAAVLLRNGALSAAALVLVVSVVAALAFAPLFLLFHYVAFPQGNFLFPPTSNLLRLYPQEYWYAVTLRIAAAFIALTVFLALIGWVVARSGRVTPR